MQTQIKKKEPSSKLAEPEYFKAHAPLEEKKTQPIASHPIVFQSMSEGLMKSALAQEDKKIENMARESYMRSVKIELEAIKGKNKNKHVSRGTQNKKNQKDDKSPPKK